MVNHVLTRHGVGVGVVVGCEEALKFAHRHARERLGLLSSFASANGTTTRVFFEWLTTSCRSAARYAQLQSSRMRCPRINGMLMGAAAPGSAVECGEIGEGDLHVDVPLGAQALAVGQVDVNERR